MVAYIAGIWQFTALSFAYDNDVKSTTLIIYANRDVSGSASFDTLFIDENNYPHMLGAEQDTTGEK